jgi:hypothetical protein
MRYKLELRNTAPLIAAAVGVDVNLLCRESLLYATI